MQEFQKRSELVPPANSIAVHVDGYFVTFKSEGKDVLRVNYEDTNAAMTAMSVLNGILGAGLNREQIENLRDVLQGMVGS